MNKRNMVVMLGYNADLNGEIVQMMADAILGEGREVVELHDMGDGSPWEMYVANGNTKRRGVEAAGLFIKSMIIEGFCYESMAEELGYKYTAHGAAVELTLTDALIESIGCEYGDKGVGDTLRVACDEVIIPLTPYESKEHGITWGSVTLLFTNTDSVEILKADDCQEDEPNESEWCPLFNDSCKREINCPNGCTILQNGKTSHSKIFGSDSGNDADQNASEEQ